MGERIHLPPLNVDMHCLCALTQVLLQAQGSISSLRAQKIQADAAARWLALEQLMKP